jgi:hypothetical protein
MPEAVLRPKPKATSALAHAALSLVFSRITGVRRVALQPPIYEAECYQARP